MTDGPPHVVAMGASTSVGRDAWSSAAAARAAICGFAEHPYMIGSGGEPMVVAVAPWLDIEIAGVERLRSLLFPALDQSLQVLFERTDALRTALALALPAPRPGLAPELQHALIASIKQRYQGVFEAIAAFPNGHAAGLMALDAAQRRLTQGTFDACVVAGVDSYLEPQTLEWLERSEQLHAGGPRNNAWGFIPGEGAAAVLLTRAGLVDQFRDTLLAQVLGVGAAAEHKRIKTPTVCIGEGLTAAFRAALQSLPEGEVVSDIYCDLNGEPYRADEYGFTCLRMKEYFESTSDFVAPADCWGDVCAASAPLHIILAAVAGTKGYARGSMSFVWASSEGGERGAALLRVNRGNGYAG